MTPIYLWLPVTVAMVMGLMYLVTGNRPVNGYSLSNTLLWVAILGAWTFAVFRTQEKRIKALEDQLSKMQRP